MANKNFPPRAQKNRSDEAKLNTATDAFAKFFSEAGVNIEDFAKDESETGREDFDKNNSMARDELIKKDEELMNPTAVETSGELAPETVERFSRKDEFLKDSAPTAINEIDEMGGSELRSFARKSGFESELYPTLDEKGRWNETKAMSLAEKKTKAKILLANENSRKAMKKDEFPADYELVDETGAKDESDFAKTEPENLSEQVANGAIKIDDMSKEQRRDFAREAGVKYGEDLAEPKKIAIREAEADDLTENKPRTHIDLSDPILQLRIAEAEKEVALEDEIGELSRIIRYREKQGLDSKWQKSQMDNKQRKLDALRAQKTEKTLPSDEIRENENKSDRDKEASAIRDKLTAAGLTTTDRNGHELNLGALRTKEQGTEFREKSAHREQIREDVAELSESAEDKENLRDQERSAVEIDDAFAKRASWNSLTGKESYEDALAKLGAPKELIDGDDEDVQDEFYMDAMAKIGALSDSKMFEAEMIARGIDTENVAEIMSRRNNFAKNWNENGFDRKTVVDMLAFSEEHSDELKDLNTRASRGEITEEEKLEQQAKLQDEFDEAKDKERTYSEYVNTQIAEKTANYPDVPEADFAKYFTEYEAEFASAKDDDAREKIREKYDARFKKIIGEEPAADPIKSKTEARAEDSDKPTRIALQHAKSEFDEANWLVGEESYKAGGMFGKRREESFANAQEDWKRAGDELAELKLRVWKAENPDVSEADAAAQKFIFKTENSEAKTKSLADHASGKEAPGLFAKIDRRIKWGLAKYDQLINKFHGEEKTRKTIFGNERELDALGYRFVRGALKVAPRVAIGIGSTALLNPVFGGFGILGAAAASMIRTGVITSRNEQTYAGEVDDIQKIREARHDYTAKKAFGVAAAGLFSGLIAGAHGASFTHDSSAETGFNLRHLFNNHIGNQAVDLKSQLAAEKAKTAAEQKAAAAAEAKARAAQAKLDAINANGGNNPANFNHNFQIPSWSGATDAHGFTLGSAQDVIFQNTGKALPVDEGQFVQWAADHGVHVVAGQTLSHAGSLSDPVNATLLQIVNAAANS
jgi:hypothetical protein